MNVKAFIVSFTNRTNNRQTPSLVDVQEKKLKRTEFLFSKTLDTRLAFWEWKRRHFPIFVVAIQSIQYYIWFFFLRFVDENKQQRRDARK